MTQYRIVKVVYPGLTRTKYFPEYSVPRFLSGLRNGKLKWKRFLRKEVDDASDGVIVTETYFLNLETAQAFLDEIIAKNAQPSVTIIPHPNKQLQQK